MVNFREGETQSVTSLVTPEHGVCAATENRSLHPRTKELLDYLDSQRDALRIAFEKVPPALKDQVPAPGCWSAAGVIEHLAMVEGDLNSRAEGADSRGVPGGSGSGSGD